MKFRRSLLLALAVGTLCPLALAQPLTSSFTYQGELSDGGAPVNGAYDLTFRLFDAASGGTQSGPTLCSDDLTVTNGKFTVSLDFGNAFPGVRRFIEVQVRSGAAGDCANTTGYTTLLPRQEVTATPYAAFAPTAGTATSAVSAANASNLNNQPGSFYQNAANLTGTLADARLSTNVPRLNVANTFVSPVTAPTFNGALNGNASTATLASNATNLGGQPSSFYQNASNLNAGTLADARLSPNVPLLNASNAFAGTNTFNGFSLFSNSTTFFNAVTMRGVGGLTVQEDSGGTGQLLLQFNSGQPTLRVAGTGTASVAGLRFATPGAITALHITNAGDVGIGTATPEAPLHVRGGASMGGIVVTPDIADTASQLLLAENTSASNAGIMRYNGTNNNIEFLGRAADVETEPNFSIARSSATATVGTATNPGRFNINGGAVALSVSSTGTGNTTVALPASSIGAGEIADEAGADQTVVLGPVALTTGLSPIATVTISAPGPGIVIVRGQFEASHCQTSLRGVTLLIEDDTGASGPSITSGLFTDCGVPLIVSDEGLFVLAAGGDRTYSLMARGSLSGISARAIKLTAIYFPTRY